MPYTAGKKALGICDQCGFQYKLNELKYNVVGAIRTKMRVCKTCADPYNPRERPAVFTSKVEAIAVRDPRPDTLKDVLNSVGGFHPCVGCEIQVYPDSQGFRMQDGVTQPAPIYILEEDGLHRLAAEDGSTLVLG